MKKTGKIRTALLAGLAGSIVAGNVCVPAAVNPLDYPDVLQIAEGDNELGKELMAKLAESGENVFVSPYSIATALSMLGNCSEKGEQIEELREFLGQGDMSEERILEGQRLLAAYLCRGKENGEEDTEWPWDYVNDMTEEEKEENGIGTVEQANILYVDDELPLVPRFAELPGLLSAYHADFASRALETEETKNEINQWVSEQTHGMIDTLLEEPLDILTRLVLINTLYFKGFWASEFLEDQTAPQTFHGANGDSEVEMMHMTDFFSYAETDKYQIAVLPYAYQYEMKIYLPKEDAVREEWTDAEALKEMENAFEENREYRELEVSMPKFELEYSAELQKIFPELGLTKIFDEDVYDRLSEMPLAVSQILHKTAIKNYEKGTEASAVTMIAMTEGAMIDERGPVTFTMDRPFYFTITDHQSGLNLFEGCVCDLPDVQEEPAGE